MATPTTAPETQLQIVTPATVLKLDLAAGQNVREGFEGVDIWPGSKHVLNLMQYPWPWADNSVDELHCSHFAEHIPTIFVDATGKEVPMGTPGAQDALFRFFDECYRILKPDASMMVIVPSGRSNRGFQDPTHRRFFMLETFLYFSKNWRDVNKLDHYNVVCNFDVNCRPMTFQGNFDLLHPAAQERRYNHEWNCVGDWVCTMRKLAAVPAQPPAA